jgi:hypothetical protein
MERTGSVSQVFYQRLYLVAFQRVEVQIELLGFGLERW